MTDYVKEYYEAKDEDPRLLSRHGSVEYLTTMRYIHKYLKQDMKILEVGAGTGRYSLALAEEGYDVEAVEYVKHNIDVFKSKIKTDNVKVMQGDARDLSCFEDESFDITLVLGPMYHFYNDEDKKQALKEALRVTKKGGYVMTAYCMNEGTMISMLFGKGMVNEYLDKGLLTDDFHCKSAPEEVFELVRTEDIDRITSGFNVEKISLVATDGATNYMRDTVDNMDDETFNAYLKYHFATCERQDLIGASHHTLQIVSKID